MGVRTLGRLLAIGVACGALVAPAAADAAQGGRGRGVGATATHREHRAVEAVVAGAYQESAFASGYEAGYDKGLADGRRGERYDPVRHGEYRDGDRGYAESHGSRDAYKDNYRAGFRQGYEAGYREGTRTRK
jgi:hypothetical protein